MSYDLNTSTGRETQMMVLTKKIFSRKTIREMLSLTFTITQVYQIFEVKSLQFLQKKIFWKTLLQGTNICFFNWNNTFNLNNHSVF